MKIHSLAFIEFGSITSVLYFKNKKTALDYLKKNFDGGYTVSEIVKDEEYYSDHCGFEINYNSGNLK